MADKVICPKCGADNFPSDPQCLSCGTRLTPARPEGPPPATARQAPGAPAASAVTPGPNRGAAAVPMERPDNVTIALVLCFLAAVWALLMVGSILAKLTLLVSIAGPGKIPALSIVGLLTLDALPSLGILAVGYFAWNGFKWARFALAALLALEIMRHAISVVTHPSLLLLISVAIYIGGLIVLVGRQAGEYCVR